jgi:hypothetical protein
MDDDLTRKIQKQSEVQYQRTQKQKIKPPPLLKIGEYHQESGRYKVIYPNGGQVISGVKLFNSSVPDGTPIRATQAYGAQSISLDYKKHIPPQIEEEETPTLTLLDTYIIAFIDTSGSMDAEIPAIENALNQLKTLLKKTIYQTQERVDKYFQIRLDGSENWLNFFSFDPRVDQETEANKAVILAFINESYSVYHEVPRDVSQEPTSDFARDRINFIDAYAQRKFFKGRVYSIEYLPDPQVESAFAAHVQAAIDGASPYPSPGLEKYDCSYTLSLPAATPSDFYLQDIKELLGLK